MGGGLLGRFSFLDSGEAIFAASPNFDANWRWKVGGRELAQKLSKALYEAVLSKFCRFKSTSALRMNANFANMVPKVKCAEDARGEDDDSIGGEVTAKPRGKYLLENAEDVVHHMDEHVFLF